MNLPEEFIKLIESYRAPQLAGLGEALLTPPEVSVRINPLKSRRLAASADTRVPWCYEGVYLPERPRFTFSPELHQGVYYVQDASSMFINHVLKSLLDGKGPVRYLDACAAPGGKTTAAISALPAGSTVGANEYVAARAAVLRENLAKWGYPPTTVTCGPVSRFGEQTGAYDVIAADVPCSGEGMMRKEAVAVEQWSPQLVEKCAALQREIVSELWPALAPGGLLIYSTCTFNRTEDEDVVAWAQSQWHDMLEPMSDIECPDAWGIARSRIGAFQTFRFMPHSARGEGFFAAAARKKGDRSAAAHRARPKSRRRIFAPADKRTAEELQRWVAEPDAMTFRTVGDTLYGYRISQLPDIAALSETLSAVYSGVAMGQMFKQRLRPDHALALYVGLNSDALPRVDVDRATALDYLRRRDIAAGIFEEGFNAVTYDGLAIGFVKRIGGRCNNLYPKDLRILKT